MVEEPLRGLQEVCEGCLEALQGALALTIGPGEPFSPGEPLSPCEKKMRMVSNWDPPASPGSLPQKS